MNPDDAQTVWEVVGQQPCFGSQLSFVPVKTGPQWVEVEARWGDGRRAFARAQVVVR